MTTDIWQLCGNTEEYPEAARCYCCSLNIVHSRAEHDDIVAKGWKSREHIERARKEHRSQPKSQAMIEKRVATQKRLREFHDKVWKDLRP